MKTGKFDFVEGLLIASVMGMMVPIACIDADTLAFPAGQTAVFVIIIQVFHLFLLGGCVTMEKGLLGRTAVTAFTSVMSVLAGFAIFRCMAEGLGASVDYTSIAGGTVIGGIVALSLLAYAAVADAMKMGK